MQEIHISHVPDLDRQQSFDLKCSFHKLANKFSGGFCRTLMSTEVIQQVIKILSWYQWL